MATSLKADSVSFAPLNPSIGVEVKGVDLTAELDDGTVAALRDAWVRHSVLLFRDQDISEDDQFRFARCLGPVADRVQPPVEKRAWRADPHNRMQLITDRLDDEGRPLGSLGHGDMWFHTDKCYVERPHRASLLYGMEIPAQGGHTKFASLYRAYDALPEDLKEKLEGRRVLQVYDYTKDSIADTSHKLEELLHYWQPVFVANPDSGRIALYVCRLMTARIEGLDEAESAAVLNDICDIIEDPAHVYEHAWRPGDLIVWDNLSSVHARTDWPGDQPHSLRRCTVQGEALN